VLSNTFGPGSLGLRLRPSRSSWPPRCGFHARLGTTRCHSPGSADDAPGLDDPTGHELKFMPARKPFLHLELLEQPIAPSLGTVEGRYRGLDPML
jgi:hypothetical protein